MKTLQEHVKSGRPIPAPAFKDEDSDEFKSFFIDARSPAPLLVCNDGFHMSVQASASHYCEPRNNQGPYTSFEIWRLSEPEPLLEEYGNGEDPYAQVPLAVVEAIINKHGGIKE